MHCIQNHDQVGNRALGDRLTDEISPAAYRALSALLLLSPYTPLLWMGQEWAATSPFQYFTDHPEELGRLVTRGRREEFGHFSAFSDPAKREAIPDPQARETFERSRLRWDERESGVHQGVLRLYRELLRLRGRAPALRHNERDGFAAGAIEGGVLWLRRRAPAGDDILLLAAPLNPAGVEMKGRDLEPGAGKRWEVLFWTEEHRFGGEGTGGTFDGDGGSVRLSGPGAVVFRAV